jgi:hypothetical protein
LFNIITLYTFEWDNNSPHLLLIFPSMRMYIFLFQCPDAILVAFSKQKSCVTGKKHVISSLSYQVNHLLDNMTTYRLFNFKTKLKYYGTHMLKHAIHGGTVIAFRFKLNLWGFLYLYELLNLVPVLLHNKIGLCSRKVDHFSAFRH